MIGWILLYIVLPVLAYNVVPKKVAKLSATLPLDSKRISPAMIAIYTAYLLLIGTTMWYFPMHTTELVWSIVIAIAPVVIMFLLKYLFFHPEKFGDKKLLPKEDKK